MQLPQCAVSVRPWLICFPHNVCAWCQTTCHILKMLLVALQIESTEKGVTVGASVTLTALLHTLKHEIKTRPAYQTSGFLAIVEQLRL